MSEEDIIKDLKNFCAMSKKEENFTYYSEYKFCEELAERVQGLLDLYNQEKEKNIELLTRLRADELIERDKYWISKIKEALYNGTSDAKGWGCEDGAYCVEKQFKQLLEEGK